LLGKGNKLQKLILTRKETKMEPLKANYNKTDKFKKQKTAQLEDGSCVYRILPAFPSFTDNPDHWRVFHSVHFGYKNMEGKLRTFESTQVKRKGVVEVPDAAVERLEELRAKLEESRANMTGPLTAKLNSLVGQKGVYNLDKNWWMNAMNLEGDIVRLKIRYRAMLVLKAEIDRLEKEEGVDALSLDNGRFFVFGRSNLGRDTTYTATVLTEKLDIPGVGKVDRPVVSNLGEDVRRRFKDEISDLFDIAPKVTPEEIEQIVKESDLMTGKSPACDRIFDQRWKAKREEKLAQGNKLVQPVAAATTGTVQQPARVELVVAQAMNQNVTHPSLTTQLTTPAPAASAPLAKTETLTATAQAPQSAQPKTQAQQIEEMSDDDFWKMSGVTKTN
jgi:hypothetical protein